MITRGFGTDTIITRGLGGFVQLVLVPVMTFVRALAARAFARDQQKREF
jgi:hypothetical protein